MRLSPLLVSLFSALIGVNACTPDFAGRQVTIGVAGTWNANPAEPRSLIVPIINGTMTFSVTEVAEKVYTFTTNHGKLAVSGASGPLRLQITNPKDIQQKYFFLDCAFCNVNGKKASARGCFVRAASNHNQCITNYGVNEPVQIIECHPRIGGQFLHFDEV